MKTKIFIFITLTFFNFFSLNASKKLPAPSYGVLVTNDNQSIEIPLFLLYFSEAISPQLPQNFVKPLKITIQVALSNDELKKIQILFSSLFNHITQIVSLSPTRLAPTLINQLKQNVITQNLLIENISNDLFQQNYDISYLLSLYKIVSILDIVIFKEAIIKALYKNLSSLSPQEIQQIGALPSDVLSKMLWLSYFEYIKKHTKSLTPELWLIFTNFSFFRMNNLGIRNIIFFHQLQSLISLIISQGSPEEGEYIKQKVITHCFKSCMLIENFIKEESRNPTTLYSILRNQEKIKRVHSLKNWLTLLGTLFFSYSNNEYSTYTKNAIYILFSNQSLLKTILGQEEIIKKVIAFLHGNTIGIAQKELLPQITELKNLETQFQSSWVKKVLPETTARKVYYVLKKQPKALFNTLALLGLTGPALYKMYQKLKTEAGY